MHKIHWLVWGWAGLGLAAGFVFPWAGRAREQKGGAEPSGKGGTEWRIAEPVRYENLAVFPVISRQSADTAAFTTLDDGLSSGDVVISEGGGEIIRRSRDGRPLPVPGAGGASVNQLVLINRGPKPLILIAGELVSGGKQDRIIAKDRIVAPGAEPLPLDVFCVEHGRWSTGAQFSAGKIMVHPSVREQAAVAGEQSKVWDAVRNGTPAAAAPPAPNANASATTPAARVSAGQLSEVIASAAPTQSYAKMYESSKEVGAPTDMLAEEIRRRFERATANLKGEAVVGVVVAYGGEVAWSDVFASPALFARYWPKLLRSYAVEAMVRPRSNEQASLEDAREFMRPFVGHETLDTEPGVYSLKQVTEGAYVQMELEAHRPYFVMLHALKVHKTS